MKEQLEAIRQEAEAALQTCTDAKQLDAIRVQYLGKKGALTAILKQMGKLSAEERPVMGQLANAVRSDIESAITKQQAAIAEAALEQKLQSETLDITLPGKQKKIGGLHPLTIVENEIKEIFLGMGFSVADGPEVEYDYYNFEALNLPPDHPARDTQDTFYIPITSCSAHRLLLFRYTSWNSRSRRFGSSLRDGYSVRMPLMQRIPRCSIR